MATFSEAMIEQIWDKATIIDGYDSSLWRKDFAGAWIQRNQYGIQSTFGWEIDHLIPVKAGGSDDMSNLNPLHWRNNLKKGADMPIFKTSVTSNGNRNVFIEKTWKIS